MPAQATNHRPGKASLVEPGALMNIRGLELRARIVVEGFWNGIHRSPYHGFSVEFTEYRQYSPDDDLRYLDWRVFARSDRMFIKKFEDETNLRCYLVADNSSSMAYGSTGYTKAQYTATLAATLAYFLYLQGDGVGLLSFDEQVRDYLPARHRKGHLRQLMHQLENPTSGRSTDLIGPLRRIAEMVRKRAMVVLVSDFLAPIDRLAPELLALAAGGHEVVLFQILDPAELKFSFSSSAMFEDLESRSSLFIEPSSAREEYLRKMEAHSSSLRESCQKIGATYHRLDTSRPLEFALFDFLRARVQHRKGVKRFHGARQRPSARPL